MLYDAYGNKIPKRPIKDEIAVIRRQDIYSTYPISGLTASRMTAIFREADSGYISRQMELYEDIEEHDSRIRACLQTRKQAVVGLTWDILPADNTGRAVEQCTFIKEVIRDIPDFEKVKLDLLDAIGKGFGMCEIFWGVKENKNVILRLEWRPQKRFIWNETQSCLHLLTDQEPAAGTPITKYPNKFLLHQYHGLSGFPSRAGILRTLSWLFLFKSFTLKDWARFCEVYAMPMRIGKYDAAATQDDRDALKAAVYAMGADGAGVISKNTEIEFINAIQGAGNGETYATFIEMLNRDIAICTLGQNLTTEVVAGSRAAATIHERIRQDILEADSKDLDQTITHKLIRPVIDYNYGIQDTYPQYVTACQPAEDRREEAQIDKILATDLELDLGEEYLREKYHVPKPNQKKREQI